MTMWIQIAELAAMPPIAALSFAAGRISTRSEVTLTDRGEAAERAPRDPREFEVEWPPRRRVIGRPAVRVARGASLGTATHVQAEVKEFIR